MPTGAGSRARAWVFTRNGTHDSSVEDQLDCRYICYGRESAPTTGTLHLQGYVYFRNGKTLRAVRALLPGCHVEIARGSFKSNHVYCSKGGNFVERGDPPKDDADRGSEEIARYDSAWNLAKCGLIEEIPAGTF